MKETCADPRPAAVGVHVGRLVKVAWRPDRRVNLSERDACALTPAADSSRLGDPRVQGHGAISMLSLSGYDGFV